MQTHTSDTRKPAFKWLGVRKLQIGYADSAILQESRKRTFGADITNINFSHIFSHIGPKRHKIESSISGDKPVKSDDGVKVAERSSSENDAKPIHRSYEFGPFAPASVAEINPTRRILKREHHDWETLADIHRPQYQNQGINAILPHHNYNTQLNMI